MGVPITELTEPVIPGHLGQVVGFTCSDRHRSQWSRSSLRHESEKNNAEKPTNENAPGLALFHQPSLYIDRLKAIHQMESSCPQLGETADTMDQIHLLPLREQQKGAKATATTWQAGGHGQRTLQDFL